jgi:pimeloyl-ACP methyl ester carboxylesterase
MVGAPITLMNQTEPIPGVGLPDSDTQGILEDILVQGNRIVGGEGLGILVQGVSRSRIAGNTIAGIQRRAPFPGITWDGFEQRWDAANGSGIWISPGSEGNEIVGNVFEDIASAAVFLEGDSNRVVLQEAADAVRDLGTGNRVNRFVEAGGARLHYLDFGGEGVPLVFVHSESWDAHTYEAFAPRFTDRARVLAITRPGYGESEAHPDGFGVATQARSLVDFLDALGIERAVFAGNSSPTTYLTSLAERQPDRVAGLVYLAGLMPFWLQDVREADPVGAGAVNARAVAARSGVSEDRSRALASYRPDFLDGDRPPVPVPTLAFAARSGLVGYEPWNEALALVGSPLMAGLLRGLPPSPFADFMRRPSEDPAYRAETLVGIEDAEARALLLRLADDPALQAEVWRYQQEVVAPALEDGQERFRQAFGDSLRVARLNVPVLHGYEYRDAPDLVEPHLRRFLESVARAEAAQEVPAYTIDQFMETVRISTASLSANGEKVLFTSDASGVPNAWAVPFAGGEPVQLTHSADPIHTYGYFPSDERFLYSADDGGDERAHIYVRNPDGSVEDLTPGENVRALFLGWSPDGRSFFFASNERDPRRMDVYEMSLDGYERTLLYRNDRGARVGAISLDRRQLAFVRRNSNNDSDLFLFDRETDEETLLSRGEGEARPIPHEFGPDGRHLYYTTDRAASTGTSPAATSRRASTRRCLSRSGTL